MKTNVRKWLLTGLALLVGVAATMLLMRPAAIEVDVAVVLRGTLVVTVEEQGKTRARERYTIAAPITGRLLRSDLTAGDKVTQGDIVASIAPPPEDPRGEGVARAGLLAAEAHLRQARALEEEARSGHERAVSELARRAELYNKNLIGVEMRDTYAQAAQAANARLTSAAAAVAAAQAQVRTARARLLGVDGAIDSDATIPVPAPVSGTVLQIYEESERVVAAGSPLIELSDSDALELIVDLLSEDAVQVRPQANMTITGWGGDTALKGIVRYVEPGAFTKISTLGVEEQRVNVIGDIIDPAPGLGAQYRIEAAIETWSGDDLLLIPGSAIFRRQSAWHTFVIEDGLARVRPITIGRRSSDYAQVLEGVEEGEKVILYPSDLIVDGVRVAARVF